VSSNKVNVPTCYVAIVVATSILTVVIAHAQPVITQITGDTTVGSVLIASGSSFGPGSVILSWDDFELDTVGESINGLSPVAGHIWDTPWTGPLGPHISGTRSYSGGKSVKCTFNDGTTSEWASYFGWVGKGPYDGLYFSYNRFLDGAGGMFDSGSINHKTVYVFGTDGGRPQITVGASMNGGPFGFTNNQGDPDRFAAPSVQPFILDNNVVNWNNTKLQWNRWEVYCKLNTPVSAANDEFQVFIDGKELLNRNDIWMRSQSAGTFRDFRIGYMDNSHRNYNYLSSYIDDIYVATGRARIELGNAPVFANCTRRDIQYFGNWNAATSTVEFTLRAPSFANNATAYLFVVDEAGAASPGYAMQIGGGSVSAPGVPGQPIKVQ